MSISSSSTSNNLELYSLDDFEAFGCPIHGTIYKGDGEAWIELPSGARVEYSDGGAALALPERLILLDRKLPAAPSADFGTPDLHFKNTAVVGLVDQSFMQYDCMNKITNGNPIFAAFDMPDGRTDVRVASYSISGFQWAGYREMRCVVFFYSVLAGDIGSAFLTVDMPEPTGAEGFYSWDQVTIEALDIAPGGTKALFGVYAYYGFSGLLPGRVPRLACVLELDVSADFSSATLSVVASYEECILGTNPVESLTPSELLEVEIDSESIGYWSSGSSFSSRDFVVGAVYDRTNGQPLLARSTVSRRHVFTASTPVIVNDRNSWVQPFTYETKFSVTHKFPGLAGIAAEFTSINVQTTGGASHTWSVDGHVLGSSSISFDDLDGNAIPNGISSLETSSLEPFAEWPSFGVSVFFYPLYRPKRNEFQSVAIRVDENEHEVVAFAGPLATRFGTDAGWRESGNIYGVHRPDVSPAPGAETRARGFFSWACHPETGQIIRNRTDGYICSFC